MFCMKVAMMSTGTGKTMVLLFSAEMLFRVCRSVGKQVGRYSGMLLTYLEVSELEGSRVSCDDISSVPQSPACLVLSLCRDHL